MSGLVESCSELLLRLVISCQQDPHTLHLLSECGTHQCMWQLLLSDCLRFRQVGLSLLHHLLSVGERLQLYLASSISTLVAAGTRIGSERGAQAASEHPLGERATGYVSPWDDAAAASGGNGDENDDSSSSGSGSGSGGRKQNQKKFGSGRNFSKMERKMYLGEVTTSLCAHVLYCLRHSSVDGEIIDALLQIMLDDDVGSDDVGGTCSFWFLFFHFCLFLSRP